MVLCGAKARRFLEPNIYTEAPDGGWGWVVAVAFFLVSVFTYGTIKSFGIFLQDLIEEFGETNSRVSWIVSICVFIMTFSAPLASVMTNRFGYQPVVIIGGFLISSGTIATSFTTSIHQMFITYGVVAGLGYCLTFLPTVTILSKYFTRRRSLVTAVASTGEPLSMFALAPAFSALRDHIGWRHTITVIGALQSIIIICGVLLRPIIIKPSASQKTETQELSPKEQDTLGAQESIEGKNPEEPKTIMDSHVQNTTYSLDNELTRSSVSTRDSGVQSLNDTEDKTLLQKHVESGGAEVKRSETGEEKKNEGAEGQCAKDEAKVSAKKLLDFSILRECNFIFYCMFGLFATLGFFAPQLYIIELSVSRGVGRDRATYMLSTMAVAEIMGRFSIGWIMSRDKLRKRKLHVLLVCVIAMTADLVGFTLVREFYGLAVCCALYGFFMGTLACTHIPLLAEDDVVGIERMSSAAGVYVFIHSFAGLAGPPLGGVLVDVTQNYGSAFYSCAAGMALSAVFLGLVKPAKKGLICGKRSSRDNTGVLNPQWDESKEQSGEHQQDKAPSPHNSSQAVANSDHMDATGDEEKIIS
ncbi:monocarboxylate transporter 7-like [Solea senegalensis]|nr:monocarboxylate transporter 7-like isoform X1 [Solea senegalensis]KAG7507723.1 monocarboxylate transporter 7-like [Solea senegalensis]